MTRAAPRRTVVPRPLTRGVDAPGFPCPALALSLGVWLNCGGFELIQIRQMDRPRSPIRARVPARPREITLCTLVGTTSSRPGVPRGPWAKPPGREADFLFLDPLEAKMERKRKQGKKQASARRLLRRRKGPRGRRKKHGAARAHPDAYLPHDDKLRWQGTSRRHWTAHVQIFPASERHPEPEPGSGFSQARARGLSQALPGNRKAESGTERGT